MKKRGRGKMEEVRDREKYRKTCSYIKYIKKIQHVHMHVHVFAWMIGGKTK
jgi:hypothetical protein